MRAHKTGHVDTNACAGEISLLEGRRKEFQNKIIFSDFIGYECPLGDITFAESVFVMHQPMFPSGADLIKDLDYPF